MTLLAAASIDLLVLGPVAISGALYLSGAREIRRRTRRGPGVAGWRMIAFGAGLLAIIVALISPIDQLSEELFAVHMVQHLLLTLVAAPLIVLGAPLVPILAALPVGWRRRLAAPTQGAGFRAIWRVASYPLTAWLLSAAVLWSWHVPAMYDLALGNQAVHIVEHASFLTAGLLFWWSLIRPVGREATPPAAAVLYVFTTGIHSSALGALLTFSTNVWYSAHEPFVAAWGLTAIEDQQLAGLIMWVPAGAVYLGAALVLAAMALITPAPARDDPTSGYAIRARRADELVRE
ncbi:cytochrome c oxidase assembly protein [soil metagenome]